MADKMEESMQDLDPEGAFGDDDVDIIAHEKLLNSIYALDGKKRLRDQVRGAGISSNNVDLLVHTKKDSTKIKATELNVKNKKTPLVAKPLSALETEKAKRKIARDVMEKDTKKWEPIVHEIRAAPQTKYAERPKGMEMYKAMQPQKFSPRTPLEIELYEALGKSEDIITPDEPLTKAERNALKAMSVKEAMERRKELMMHHELLSRMQIKAKRIKKIKSKRYRRGLRKEKEATEKRKVEQLRLTDPEAFLENLDKVDKARMEERLTLKHKSGGKFARYHKAYSKYDDVSREAVQEMIRKGKELTQKRQIESSDEDDEEVQLDSVASKVVRDDYDMDDETKKDSDLNTKHLDIMKAISKKAGGWLDSSTKYVYKDKHAEDKNDNITGKGEEDLASNDTDNEQEEKLTGEDESIKEESQRENSNASTTANLLTKKRKREDSLHSEDVEDDVTPGAESSSPSKIKENYNNDNEDLDESVTKMPEKKQKTLSKDNVEGEVDSSPKSSKKKRKRRRGGKKSGVEGNAEQEGKPEKDVIEEVTLKPSELDKTDKGMDKVEKEDDDDEEMAVTMEELFEDEDVVEQFARDKAEEDEKRKPKEENVKLPGWGSWSGPDFKKAEAKKMPNSKRRRKFLPKPKKEVDKHPNLWLNPNRDGAIRTLQPKKVPFPYVSGDQYASAIRQPVSRGFVRETAHKILVKPEVVTKLGHIIKPLNKDDFFKSKDSLEVDEQFGKEIKYVGPINFKDRDSRLKTKR